MADPFEGVDLAASSRWVRALALDLAADAHRADDLAQDTWLAALSRMPALDRPLRAWLRTVIVRRAAEMRREDANRRAREAHVAPSEALPSTLDMVERAATQRDLVQAVLDLDEPYRTTILWRYFEGLAPREIARRANVPVATVHSRIARAHAQLRARLDHDHGRAGAWIALVARSIEPPSAISANLGALAMSTATKTGIAAACIAVGVVWWAAKAPSITRSITTVTRAVSDSAPLEPAHATSLALSTGETSRTIASAAIDVGASHEDRGAIAVAAARKTRRVQGQVIDGGGTPLSGIALSVEPEGSADDTHLASGADGRFELDVTDEAAVIRSADSRWATVFAGAPRAVVTAPVLVVLAPRVDVGGRVIDEFGRALDGVELRAQLPESFASALGRALDGSMSRAWHWKALTDAHGEFAMSDLPSVDGATLRAVASGREPVVVPLPSRSDARLEIAMMPTRATEGRLQGIVVDASGAAVAGARVSAGWETTASDSEGRFEIDLRKEPPPLRVMAVVHGLLPAVHTVDRASDWPQFVELRLGSAPLSIHGRVIDDEGAPVEGAHVQLDDPTLFGQVEGDELVAVETLVGHEHPSSVAYVPSARDGTFVIEGLAPRAYTLKALDPRTLLGTFNGPVDAGKRGFELRLPTRAVIERLTGRLVTRDGTPVSDVSVQLMRAAYRIRYPNGDWGDMCEERESVAVDADGRFAFEAVPRDGCDVAVKGDSVESKIVPVKADGEPLIIVVERRFHLQVQLADPRDRVDEVRLFKADGHPVFVRFGDVASSHGDHKVRVDDGRSPVLAFGEGAAVIALYKQGVEIARDRLTLSPEQVNVFRY